METGLFEIQADHLNGLGSYNLVQPASRQLVYALFEPRAVAGDDEVPACVDPFAKRNVDFARCFLRLSNLPNYALDRLSRYEATLWRQVAQTVITLGALDRRKPQERRRPPRFGSLQELPNQAHEDGCSYRWWSLFLVPCSTQHLRTGTIWRTYLAKFGFVSSNSRPWKTPEPLSGSRF